MALSPKYFLSSIVATRAASFSRFNTLAVNHGGRGTCRAPDPFAVLHHQVMCDGLPHTAITPRGKPAIDGLVGREAARQYAPGNAATQDVEDGVNDLSQRPFRRTADSRRGP